MSNFATGRINWEMDTPPVEGPNRSFSDSFAQAFDEQTTGWGVLSVEKSLEDAEVKLQSDIFKKTGKRLPLVLFNNQDAIGMARHFEGKGDLPESIAKRMKEIDALRADYPDIGDYAGLWDDVKKTAQGAEAKGATMQRRGRSLGSRAGGFLGAAIGSMNPDTDPINFFTLGLGGVGKGVAGRIAQEVGIGGGIEAVNQFTGVQENRELLGLSYGFGEAVKQIAVTGAGAGILRGGVEGISAGARHLKSRKTPTERARAIHEEGTAQIMEQSPYGDTPAAQRMFADEFEARHIALQEWDTTPRSRSELMSSTAIPELPVGNVVRGAPDLLAATGRNVVELDDAVRSADPALARQYDEVNLTISKAEARITDLEAERSGQPSQQPAPSDKLPADQKVEATPTGKPVAEAATDKPDALIEGAPDQISARPAKEVDAEIAAEMAKIDKVTDQINALNARREQLTRSGKKGGPDGKGFVEGAMGRELSDTITDDFSDPKTINEMMDKVDTGAQARIDAARQQLDADGAIEISGTRVPKDTIISTDEGDMTIEAIFKDFSEDDELMNAALSCKVSL